MSGAGTVRPIALASLVLANVVVAGACGPPRTLDPSETAPVRIGVIVPLRGELGSDGQSWRDSVVLAVREVNAAGGVLPGRRVELIVEDGESTVAGGVAAAERLIDAGVVAIIGDVASSATLAILDGPLATTDPPILLVSAMSSSPLLTERNAEHVSDDEAVPPDWWFLRTVPPDDGQYVALGNAMYDHGDAGCRRVAILYLDNDYGRPFRDGIAAQYLMRANATGEGTLVPSADGIPFGEDVTNYDAQVSALAAANPDCVALIAYPQSAGYIVNAWSLLSTRPVVQWFGTDGIRQQGFADEVGDPSLIDGFLGTAPITELSTSAYVSYRELYQAHFGGVPAAFGSNLYDATALVMLAIAKAGSTEDREAIRDAILELNEPAGSTVVQAGELAEGLRAIRMGAPINYDGASGSVDIDRFGNPPGVFELWRFDAATESFVSQGTVQ